MSETVQCGLVQKCFAEAIGTGIIVTGGCGFVCALKYAKNNPAGPLGAPAIFGTAVTLAILTTRDISGAHLNPAITASLAINRPDSIPKSHVLPYMMAQMVGGTLGAGANYLMFKQGIKNYELEHGIKRGAKGSCEVFNGAFGMVADRKLLPKSWMVFACEAAFTAALAFVVFAMTDP
jgi:glycerol uptake facilitator-like aquaporin